MSIAIAAAAVFLIIMFAVTRRPAPRILAVLTTLTAFTAFALVPSAVANAKGTPDAPTMTVTSNGTGTEITMLGVNVNETTATLATLNGWTEKHDSNLKTFGDLFGTEAEQAIRGLMDTAGNVIGTVSEHVNTIIEGVNVN